MGMLDKIGAVDNAAIDEETAESEKEEAAGGLYPFKLKPGWSVLKLFPAHPDQAKHHPLRKNVPYDSRRTHFFLVGEDTYGHVVCPRKGFKDSAPCKFCKLTRRVNRWEGESQDELRAHVGRIRAQKKYLWLGVDLSALYDLENEPELIEDRPIPKCFGTYKDTREQQPNICKRCPFRESCIRGLQLISVGKQAQDVLRTELKKTNKAGMAFVNLRKEDKPSSLVFIKRTGKKLKTRYPTTLSVEQMIMPKAIRALVNTPNFIPVSTLCVPTPEEEANRLFGEMLAFWQEDDPDMYELLVAATGMKAKSEKGDKDKSDDDDDDGDEKSSRSKKDPEDDDDREDEKSGKSSKKDDDDDDEDEAGGASKKAGKVKDEEDLESLRKQMRGKSDDDDDDDDDGDEGGKKKKSKNKDKDDDDDGDSPF